MKAKPVAEVRPHDTVQLTLRGALFHQLATYLAERDLHIRPYPFEVDDDDIPSYTVEIGQALWDQVNSPSNQDILARLSRSH